MDDLLLLPLHEYWDCDRAVLETAFEGVDFSPLKEVGDRIREEEVSVMPVEVFIGYLRSTSAYRTMMFQGGKGMVDPLVELEKQLRALVGQEGKLSVACPFFAVIATKKEK